MNCVLILRRWEQFKRCNNQGQTGSAATSRDGKLCSTQPSEKTALLRSLNADSHFRWDAEVHWKVFKDVNTVLSNTPVMSLFDEHKELALRCNAFALVLGACLFQEGQSIIYVSRSLTETKFNYVQIEKEFLAVAFLMERFEN